LSTTNCGVSADCGTAVPVGVTVVTPTPCPSPNCTPVSYTEGDWTYSNTVDGCFARTRTSTNLTDGVYPNATITMLNGHITSVVAGSNILQSRPEPCMTTSGTTPTVTTLTLSPAPCNILTGNINNLWAGLTFNQTGQSIAVTGCGTASSPLVLSYTGTVATVNSISSTTLTVASLGTAYTIDSVGATQALNSGYQITNGIVKQFTIPIHTITAGRGVEAAQTVSGTNGAWTVASTDSTKQLIGVTCGTTFVDPSTGSLPVSGAWDIGTAAVYGTRLFIYTEYAATVYNDAGGVVGASPGFVTYGTSALALAAMDTLYTFSGTATC
jgi:hypothetical protein